MRPLRLATRACFAAVVCMGRMVAAQPVPPATGEPVRLEVRAPATCTDTDRFFARVRAQTSRARLAVATEPGRTFVIDIDERSDGTSGKLTIRDPSGSVTERELAGRNCQEAVEALAFVVALAVDPTIVSAAPVTPPPPPPSVSTSASKPRWSGGVALEGLAMGAVAPDYLLGGRLGFVLSVTVTDLFAPSLRAMGSVTLPSTVSTQWGTAHIQYYGGSLELCVLRLATGQIALRAPCLTGEVGQVYAYAGDDVVDPKSDTRGWRHLGAGLRVEWNPAGRITLAAGGTAFAPLRRDHYSFGTIDFYTVPTAGFAANLGVEVRLF